MKPVLEFVLEVGPYGSDILYMVPSHAGTQAWCNANLELCRLVDDRVAPHVLNRPVTAKLVQEVRRRFTQEMRELSGHPVEVSFRLPEHMSMSEVLQATEETFQPPKETRFYRIIDVDEGEDLAIIQTEVPLDELRGQLREYEMRVEEIYPKKLRTLEEVLNWVKGDR